MSSPAGDKALAGVLYVVATPLGNLQDMTERARAVLASVDLVVAEDTRRTRKLLAHYGVAAPLASYHDDSTPEKTRALVDRLRGGQALALLSDSGTPAVSDPGAELVRAAWQAGARVVPVPGPSALTAAFSVAGLASAGFVFAGYPPRKPGEKRRFLEQLAAEPRPAIMYEAPRRVADTLSVLAALCPDRPLLVARELTKIHEELRHGTVAELAQEFAEREPRGEFVLVLGPAAEPAAGPKVAGERLREAVTTMLAAGMSPRDAAHVLGLLADVPRNDAYDLVQSLAAGR